MPVHISRAWDNFVSGPNLNPVNFDNGYASSLSWILLSSWFTKQHRFLASFSSSILSECLGERGNTGIKQKDITDVKTSESVMTVQQSY